MCVHIIIEKMKINTMKQSIKNTVLLEASKNGNLKMVLRSIVNGADIKCKDLAGNTALILASIGGHFEVVKFLVGKDAEYEYETWVTLDLMHQDEPTRVMHRKEYEFCQNAMMFKINLFDMAPQSQAAKYEAGGRPD